MLQAPQAQEAQLFTDSAEDTSAIFTQLYNAVRPHLKNYINDLIKHDRNALGNYIGPFLYGYRESGTDLLKLIPIKDYLKAFPGETKDSIKKVMDQEIMWITYLGGSPERKGDRNNHFLYYDGTQLKTITVTQAQEIWAKHTQKAFYYMDDHIDLADSFPQKLFSYDAWGQPCR